MGKNLLAKAGMVGLPKAMPEQSTPDSTSKANQSPANPESLRPKTAPGAMLHFMAKQSTVMQESETLKTKLAAFEGAKATRQLDPRTVKPSIWANRHEASFQDLEFATLKAEIESAGGNVQPIKVRSLVAKSGGVGQSNPLNFAEAPVYEIVYGHRRHRACLELGLPVLAFIDEVSEQQLFVEMERENRVRKDLSAWEQGRMYARALDQGLYPSNRQLAASIGRDLGDVGRALALARLPDIVVAAFQSPLDLQFRWAKPLSDIQQKDPEGLIERAKSLQGRAGQRGPWPRIFSSFWLAQTEGLDSPTPPLISKLNWAARLWPLFV